MGWGLATALTSPRHRIVMALKTGLIIWSRSPNTDGRSVQAHRRQGVNGKPIIAITKHSSEADDIAGMKNEDMLDHYQKYDEFHPGERDERKKFAEDDGWQGAEVKDGEA